MKFKLYHNKKNKKLISQIELAAQIYNHCIALHKRYYKLYNKYIPVYTLQKHITKLKKLKKHQYWNRLDAQAIQNVVERIDKAYKLFFKKHNKRTPSFKSRHKYKSFTLKQTGYKFFDNNHVKIGKWNFRFFKSRDIPVDNIRTVTVKRDKLGDLYLLVVCEVDETKNSVKTGKTAGFDFGLKMFLTTSDNEEIESPLFLRRSLDKLKRLHRELSTKKKGSNNRRKARLSLARLYKKIENQRHDFQFKLARYLCERYDVLCFEDLSLLGMVKLWGRKVSDLSFAKFLTILEYYAQKLGKEVVKINRFFPSSKTCRHCGCINKNLQLWERVWQCPECSEIIERDFNAAVLIKTVGTSTVRRDSVRHSQNLVSAGAPVACILESHEL